MTDEKEQKRVGASRPIDDSKSFSPGTCGRAYRNPLILSWSKVVPCGVEKEQFNNKVCKKLGQNHPKTIMNHNQLPFTNYKHRVSSIQHPVSSIEIRVFYAKQTQSKNRSLP